MSFELPNLDNFEADLDAQLAAFEQDGASLSRPVLAEGYYPAFLKELSGRFGITNSKTKKYPNGEERPWFSLSASFTVDSAIARESVKSDNNPVVFTDNDSNFLPQFFDVSQFGFSQEGNGQLWAFVGSILAQVGMAELKEEDGTRSYLINGDVIRNIFDDKYKEEVKRLYGLAKEGNAISDDAKLNDVRLIPGMLAALLIKNISGLLTDQKETSECVILVGRTKDNRTQELRHFAKNYILLKDAADYEDQILR